MPDALTRLLSRFTPDGGVDRDALMYQAGRASVPSPARWKALAALLALGQALTLLLLLSRPDTPAPVAPRVSPPAAPSPATPAGGWAARRELLDRASEPVRPRGETNLVPDDPPLRVYTSWTSLPID
jgi:hypothetical protein